MTKIFDDHNFIYAFLIGTARTTRFEWSRRIEGKKILCAFKVSFSIFIPTAPLRLTSLINHCIFWNTKFILTNRFWLIVK